MSRRMGGHSIEPSEEQKTAFRGKGEKHNDEGDDAGYLEPKQCGRQPPEQ
jgi:hypothetical protein